MLLIETLPPIYCHAVPFLLQHFRRHGVRCATVRHCSPVALACVYYLWVEAGRVSLFVCWQAGMVLTLAKPKSVSLRWPSTASTRLLDLRSRYTAPAASWTARRASTTSAR